MDQIRTSTGLSSPPTGQVDDDTRLTYGATALYLANELYAQALAQDDPAETLDDIADSLPEVLPAAFKTLGTDEQLAAVLLPEVSNRVGAFTVVEHARAEDGEDYGWVFDVLADSLKRGADPQKIRADVPRVVEKLRTLLNHPGRDRTSAINPDKLTAAQRGPAWLAKYGCAIPECGLDHAGEDGEPGWHSSMPIETVTRDIAADQPLPDEPFLSAQIVVHDYRPQAYGRKTEVWLHYGRDTGQLSPAEARQVAVEGMAFFQRMLALCDRADEIATGDFEGDPEIERLDREAETRRIKRISEELAEKTGARQ